MMPGIAIATMLAACVSGVCVDEFRKVALDVIGGELSSQLFGESLSELIDA